MEIHILILGLLASTCNSAKIPSYFKRCYRKQIDFDECYKIAAQNAVQYLKSPIPELGLPSLDPLEIPQMSISAGTGPVGFTQDYKNIKLFGLSATNCTDSRFDFGKKMLFAVCKSPELKSVFDYEFDGKILLLPLHGKGTGSTIIVDSMNTLTFFFDEYEKNGKKYYKVIRSTFKMHPQKLFFKFGNLLGNDQAMNENLNQVFNDNWKALYEDVGKSYEDAYGQVFASIFSHMLEKLSISDLFGDE